jgi:hypothetical protein
MVDRAAGVRRCEHWLAGHRIYRAEQRRVRPASGPLWIRGLLQPLDERPHIEPFHSLPGPVLAMQKPEPAQQIERVAAQRRRAAIRGSQVPQIARCCLVLQLWEQHPPRQTRLELDHTTRLHNWHATPSPNTDGSTNWCSEEFSQLASLV